MRILEGNPFLRRKRIYLKIKGEVIPCFVKAHPSFLRKSGFSYIVEIKNKKLLIDCGEKGAWFQINHRTPLVSFIGSVIGKYVDEAKFRDELRMQAYELEKKEHQVAEENAIYAENKLKQLKEDGRII